MTDRRPCIELNLGRVSFTCLIDTGAARSIISEKCFKHLIVTRVVVSQKDGGIHLRSLTGEVIPALGVVTASVWVTRRFLCGGTPPGAQRITEQ